MKPEIKKALISKYSDKMNILRNELKEENDIKNPNDFVSILTSSINVVLADEIYRLADFFNIDRDALLMSILAVISEKSQKAFAVIDKARGEKKK